MLCPFSQYRDLGIQNGRWCPCFSMPHYANQPLAVRRDSHFVYPGNRQRNLIEVLETDIGRAPLLQIEYVALLCVVLAITCLYKARVLVRTHIISSGGARDEIFSHQINALPNAVQLL